MKSSAEKRNDRMHVIFATAHRLERERLERGEIPNPNLTEVTIYCIACGCSCYGIECEECGDLSCKAHSYSCPCGADSLCQGCYGRKHDECKQTGGYTN